MEATATAMRAQIDAAIEKAQEQQLIDKEKEKVTADWSQMFVCARATLCDE